MIRLDSRGLVAYASPNALSAYHRMGHASDLVGLPLAAATRDLVRDPFDAKEVVELMGPDRVIFGSDWPHIEGLPEPLDYVTELAPFDDATQQKILRENTLELTTPHPRI